MASPALTACVCVLLLPTGTGTGLRSEDRLCVFSNKLQRAESASTNGMQRGGKENGTIRCSRGSSCYGLWENRADGEMLLLKQGCWTFVGNQPECRDDGCFLATAISSQMQKANYHFCCCNQDLCNANYTKAPPTTTSPDLKPIKRDHGNRTDHQFPSNESTLITVGTVATAATVIMALFLGYGVMKRRDKNAPSAADGMEAANPEAAMDVDRLKLLDVEKNLREMSDDYLMELKQFGSQLQAANCERLQSTEATSLATAMKSQQGSIGPTHSCLFSTNPPNPKQQTLPQRPTSLHLPPNKKSPTASSRPKLGKLKFVHQQVETGVAVMNRVSEVSVLAEPHLVTTVTNSAVMRSATANGKGLHSVCRGTGQSVPTVIGRGRVNPAGPQEEEEEEEEEEVKLDIGMKEEESHLILLNCGPEEHEPLLRREQRPAESELHPLPQNKAGNISTGLVSNSNNNNNRPASQIHQRGRVSVLEAESEQAAQTLTGSSASVSQQERGVLRSGLKSHVSHNGTPSVQVPLTICNKTDRSDNGPLQETAEKALALDFTQRDQLLRSAVVVRSRDPNNQLSVSEEALKKTIVAAPKAQLSQELDPPSEASNPDAPISDSLTCRQTSSSVKPPGLEDPSLYREASPLTPETAMSKFSLDRGSKLQHEDLQIPTGEPELIQFRVQRSKARRRPCSLELSSSCSSSDCVSMSSDGSLSATGEKIKRRVKTPYTLKKWCTTSWVVSADPSLSSDLDTSTRSTCPAASGVRGGRVHRTLQGTNMNQTRSVVQLGPQAMALDGQSVTLIRK